MGTMDNAKEEQVMEIPVTVEEAELQKRDHYGKDYRAWEKSPSGPECGR